MTTEFIHGDCLKVLRRMESGSVDIVVTSPPYNTLPPKNHKPSRRFVNSAWLKTAREEGYEDNMPEEDYQGWLGNIVIQCLRVSKGLVWINHKIRYRNGQGVHPLHFLHIPIWCEVIWDRMNTMVVGHQRFAPSHELIYGFGRPHWWNEKEKIALSVWRIGYDQHKNKHPCSYPVEIARRPIVYSCPPGGTVLDPFLGSGTTAVAALQCGRNCIGIEKLEKYLTEARQRVERAERTFRNSVTGRLAGFGFGKKKKAKKS